MAVGVGCLGDIWSAVVVSDGTERREESRGQLWLSLGRTETETEGGQRRDRGAEREGWCGGGRLGAGVVLVGSGGRGSGAAVCGEGMVVGSVSERGEREAETEGGESCGGANGGGRPWTVVR